jgi:hypothetical protein
MSSSSITGSHSIKSETNEWTSVRYKSSSRNQPSTVIDDGWSVVGSSKKPMDIEKSKYSGNDKTKRTMHTSQSTHTSQSIHTTQSTQKKKYEKPKISREYCSEIIDWLKSDENVIDMMSTIPSHWKSTPDLYDYMLKQVCKFERLDVLECLVEDNPNPQNRTLLIKELTKHLRYDTLVDLVTHDRNFFRSMSNTKYSMLQYVSYPNNDIAKIATLDDLISTLTVLVERYKCHLTCMSENGDEKPPESVYGALMARSNPLLEDVRFKFYDWLTNSVPRKWLLSEFISILNKINSTNIIQFNDWLLMCLCRDMADIKSGLCKDTETFACAVLKQLMRAKVNAIAVQSIDPSILISHLLGGPNNFTRDFRRFFSIVNYNDAIEKFVDLLLSYGDSWVKNETSKCDEDSEEYNSVLATCYANYFIALGIIYHKGFAKKQILKRMYEQVKEDVRPTWLLKAIGMFIINAKITIGCIEKTSSPNSESESESESESKFVKLVIRTFFHNSSIMEKANIAKALSTDYEEIEQICPLDPVVELDNVVDISDIEKIETEIEEITLDKTEANKTNGKTKSKGKSKGKAKSKAKGKANGKSNDKSNSG